MQKQLLENHVNVTAKKVFVTLILMGSLGLTACGGGGSSSESSNGDVVPKPSETPSEQPEVIIVDTPDSNVDTDNSTDQPDGKVDPNTPVEVSGCPKVTQQQMLAAVNKVRQSPRICGTVKYPATGALTWDATLAKSSALYAEKMATENFFSHGKDVDTRLQTLAESMSPTARKIANEKGYKGVNISVGENLAGGQTSLDEAISQLLESPTHCREIMRATNVRMGMSCSYNANSKYKVYWVQHFFGLAENTNN